MPRKWIQSADVEVTAAGALLTDLAGCTALAGGTKTVAAAATPEPLVAEPTPCRRVWLGAPMDADGNPVNTKPVLVGPVGQEVLPILPANFEGVVLGVADAETLSVKVGADGEGVRYLILS